MLLLKLLLPFFIHHGDLFDWDTVTQHTSTYSKEQHDLM